MRKTFKNILSANQLKKSTNGQLVEHAKKEMNFKLDMPAADKVDLFGELMRNADQLIILGNVLGREHKVGEAKGFSDAESAGDEGKAAYVDGLIKQLELTDVEVAKMAWMNQFQNYLANNLLVFSETTRYEEPTGNWMSAGCESSGIQVFRENDKLFADYYIKNPGLRNLSSMDKKIIHAEVSSTFELTENGPVLQSIAYDRQDLGEYFMSGKCNPDNLISQVPSDDHMSEQSHPDNLISQDWRSHFKALNKKTKEESFGPKTSVDDDVISLSSTDESGIELSKSSLDDDVISLSSNKEDDFDLSSQDSRDDRMSGKCHPDNLDSTIVGTDEPRKAAVNVSRPHWQEKVRQLLKVLAPPEPWSVKQRMAKHDSNAPKSLRPGN